MNHINHSRGQGGGVPNSARNGIYGNLTRAGHGPNHGNATTPAGGRAAGYAPGTLHPHAFPASAIPGYGPGAAAYAAQHADRSGGAVRSALRNPEGTGVPVPSPAEWTHNAGWFGESSAPVPYVHQTYPVQGYGYGGFPSPAGSSSNKLGGLFSGFNLKDIAAFVDRMGASTASSTK